MFNKALAWSFHHTRSLESACCVGSTGFHSTCRQTVRTCLRSSWSWTPPKEAALRYAPIMFCFTGGKTLWIRSCWPTPQCASLRVSCCDMGIQYALVTVTKSVCANLIQLQHIWISANSPSGCFCCLTLERSFEIAVSLSCSTLQTLFMKRDLKCEKVLQLCHWHLPQRLYMTQLQWQFAPPPVLLNPGL